MPMEVNWDLQYGELAEDTEFVNTCEDLKQNLQGVHKVLQQLLPLKEHYDKLDLPSKIELDLLLVYTLNSLHWINLRLKGIDPNTHPIKGELERIQAAMKRWQEVKDRDNRPTVNVDAAKRFVRHGLYDHQQKSDKPPNKKTKFDE